MGQATDEMEKPVQICLFFALIMYDITVIPPKITQLNIQLNKFYPNLIKIIHVSNSVIE